MSDTEVERIQQHFDRMFAEGQMPWTEHELEEPIRQLPDRLLAEKSASHVLDIGCGNGWVSLFLAANGLRVTGIDSSPTAIMAARQAAQEANLAAQLAFDVGDGLSLPYETATFDVILDRGFFHHVPEDEYSRYLTEVTRVLKGEGLLSLHAFSTRNNFGHQFSADDISRIFGQHFELLEHSEDAWPTAAPAHLGHYLLRKT